MHRKFCGSIGAGPNITAIKSDVPRRPGGRSDAKFADLPRAALGANHKRPKLAIVIASYNYERYVERAIRSVVSQAREDCELVVVDDGSTDASWDVINRLSVKAFRIENRGARGACLFGLDQTQAPFVLFLDADDELKPGSIGAIIAKLDPGVAKLQFPLTRIDAEGDVIGPSRPPLEAFRARDDLTRRILRTAVYRSPPTSGNVFRRDVCEIIREATYDPWVDGTILFAAPFLGDVVSLSDELGCYRIHGANTSGLGRLPDAATLERDIACFVARIDHLRAILHRLEPSHDLVRPQATYFYRERRFYAEIARGQKPAANDLPPLVRKLWQDHSPVKVRAAMTILFVLAFLLPIRKARHLLEYRFQVQNRSALGFLKVMLRAH